ncbi:MAG: glycoside hydrolase family 38 C-terminal domain-containing protein [Candidatus Heimdallarchaeota archaeon]
MTGKKANAMKEVFIVPSTHWDREWYKPFQEFRLKLVELIEDLLEILEENDYSFTFDGQTIILEDFFEVKPEHKEQFLEVIRAGKVAVGPWYLLPDEWLIGQESFVRNLEFALTLSQKYQIPLMNVGYLPDQFGHTRAIPQLLGDLTTLRWAVIWRGVGNEITKVPFFWKCHPKAETIIKVNYLPFSYGNAAYLSSELSVLPNDISGIVRDLEPFSPLPLFLLMNGTDHQFPNKSLITNLPKVKIKGMKLHLSLLEEYIRKLDERITEEQVQLDIYAGEFRSSARAPLLQDTYSTRMWIKLWNAKIEDLLVHYLEPQFTILQLAEILDYPKNLIELAWNWFLKNQPHDSICGCSVDQTHNEMISRFSWAESICSGLLESLEEKLQEKATENSTSLLTYNPSNNGTSPSLIRFKAPVKMNVKKVFTTNGEEFPVQPISSSEEILFENNFKPFFIKTGIKMLPGRKLMDVYLNEVFFAEDVADPTLYHITMILGKKLIGELNTQKLKEKVLALVDSGKYKKFHVKATLGSQRSYLALVPLRPWSYEKLLLSDQPTRKTLKEKLTATKNSISNKFYRVKFNRNGTFSLFDKQRNVLFTNQHAFEDLGDRGDEYTFSAVKPDKARAVKVHRKLKTVGPLFAEIEQTMLLKVYAELSEDRTKRSGKAIIPVSTTFRFYRDLPRIDITTTLTNTAKDHRLRICFPLPFESPTTKTSTHFGFIERQGEPVSLEEFAEQPSGIQPQKRFIRIEDPKTQAAFSLFNKGLPEVELVHKQKLALTLIRAVGFLSRQDFPERPMHAGPFLETPGAQELHKEYTFEYSLLIHAKEMPINETVNAAESFALPPVSYPFVNNTLVSKLQKPLISFKESMIKISSLRIRDNALTVLLYNIDQNPVELPITTLAKFQKCEEKTIEGVCKKTLTITNGNFNLKFKPFELKLLKIT